jgi:hypothetical protein
MTRACRPGSLALALAFALLVPALTAGQDQPSPPSSKKVRRWESNLSGGGVSNGRIGLVKSIWWYPLPKYVALGLTFDYVYEAMPMSVAVSLNAPTPFVVPFVCAGAGGTLTVGGLSYYGGGLKVRLYKRFGLIAEYRKYTYQHDSNNNPPVRETLKAEYFGGGIAWFY